HTFTLTTAGPLRGRTFTFPGGPNIVAQAPGAGGTIYVGTANLIAQSTDSGVTFTLTGWPFTNVTAIAVNPVNANMILVGTNRGLAISTNGGIAWNPVTIPAQGYPTTIAFSTTDPRVILVGLNAGAGKGGGILRSSDGGATFRVSNTGLSTAVRNTD